MSKDPFEYLNHINDECQYILTVISDQISKDEFLENETLKRAIVRSLEIIGEASKKIPVDAKINCLAAELSRYKSVNYFHIAASCGEYNPRDPSTTLGISSTKWF